MKGYSIGIIFFVLTLGFGSGSANAQTRQSKVCVPDYSVGVMPFFIAKQNGYFAQEQVDVEVIAGRGNLCTMGLIANSFQFTYSPSTFDAIVAGEKKTEYRDNKAYWRSRLIGIRYEEVTRAPSSRM